MKTISHARGFVQRLGLRLAGIDPSHFVLSMPMAGHRRTINLTIGNGEFSIAPSGGGGTVSGGGAGNGHHEALYIGGHGGSGISPAGAESRITVTGFAYGSAGGSCDGYSEGGRSGRDQVGPFHPGTSGSAQA